MRMDEKERIQDSTRKKYWWIRLKYGINTLMSSRKHQMAFVIFIAAMFAWDKQLYTSSFTLLLSVMHFT